MPVKVDEYDGICVLAISGDLTGNDAASVRKAVGECIDRRQISDFVVDLEHSSFIDSDGLETLLWIKRRCEDLAGQFKLAAVHENVNRILELTRLGIRFETAMDVASGLKTMR